MGRGVVSGLIWGMIVSVVVLAGVSLNMPLPERAGPGETSQPASQDQGAASQSDQGDGLASQNVAPVEMPAPEIPDLASDTAPQIPQADVTDTTAGPAPAPEALPETPADALAEVTPAAEPAAADLEAALADAPILAMPPADLVASPPEQPVALSMAQAAVASLSDPQTEGTTPPAAPSPLMAQDRDDSPEALDTATPVPPTPQAAPAAAVAPVATPAPVTLPDRADAPALPQVAPPMASLPDLMTPPTVPDTPPAAVTEPAESAAPAQPAPPLPVEEPAQGALARNAVDFTADPDRPLMSIILIDDPEGPLSAEVLAQISFPVSFAIDPRRSDADARAALLREAGFEVLILAAAAIPAGAAATDVEVSLAAAQQTIPQAVAMLDSPDSRIQADRPVLEATIAVLVDSGHGLVAFPRNLNAAEQGARRDGVPAATAFRLLDDADQRAPVITRYLDRAAFAAGQDGAVIVVGRSRPDTVTAMFSWALGGRGEGVSLAPISAVLRRLSE